MKPGRSHPWRKPRQNAPESPVEAPTAKNRREAGERAIAAETARIVPSDAEIDAAAEITSLDIAFATNAWDVAQVNAGTKLEGMLDARVDTDA